MELMGKGREHTRRPEAEEELYRALTVGDLPAAWLAARFHVERAKTEKLSYATAFNCALCLFRLEEYEMALAELRQAEQSLGSPPDFDMAERKLFVQALSVAGAGTALYPLDPASGKHLERYGLLRVKWLAALCLLRLGRQQEAAAGIRFLRQYQIEVT